jgi:hypothetical protein
MLKIGMDSQRIFASLVPRVEPVTVSDNSAIFAEFHGQQFSLLWGATTTVSMRLYFRAAAMGIQTL